MRQTESLQVAIHAAKGTKSDGGSWGIREYDVIVGCFLSDKKRECKRMGKRMYGIISFAYRIPYPHAAAASRLPRIWNPSLSRDRFTKNSENQPVETATMRVYTFTA